MIVVNLFLTALDAVFFAGLAISCVAIPIVIFGAFKRAFNRALDRRWPENSAPPRNRRREDIERAKHEAHMGRAL